MPSPGGVEPTSTAAPTGGAHYIPPKYRGDSSPLTFRVMAIVALVVVLGGVGFLAMQMRPTASADLTIRPLAGGSEAGLASAESPGTVDPADASGDAIVRAGWVGTADLPAERAVITVATLAEDDPVMRRFAADFTRPVTLASIEVDNAAGTTELSVNTSGAMLDFSDGAKMQALDVMPVLETAQRNRPDWQKQLIQPYTVRPGQVLSGRLLIMPADANFNRLTRIDLHVNGQSRQINGKFMDVDAKARLMQTARAKPAAS